ncbi:MAG TPA: hypothetical protein VG605_14195 [Puia sp.]|nr:hypothetical protein [Puia sp.]
MLVKIDKFILCFILCFPLLSIHAQGLQFKSEDSLLTQRTSYHVFSSDVPVFGDHFFIAFDLSLWENANLGYVFNLTDKANSYSLSYLYTNGTGNLNFNIDSKSNKLKMPLSPSLLKKKNWFKVRLDLDLKNDRVTVRIDDKVYHADGFGFSPGMPANLIFGKNQRYTEVPNMAVRNLEVGDGKRDFFFPLNEWTGNTVHDSLGQATGVVENPIWLINESYFWKQVYSQSYQDVAGLNFDPLDENLFIFTKDSLIQYDPEEKKTSASPYANKLPVPMVLGKSIFNARENRCYIYELFDIPKGEPSIASLNMAGGNFKWETVGKVELPSQLHHHNIFYDWRQDEIYLFGGYGSYSYHNAFLRYNDTVDKWERASFTGDTISPRFFAATGPSDKPDEMFLFGGYGNESGSQVVGGRQYYDLYRIDLRHHRVKRCWTMTPAAGDIFVPANNLVLSRDKRYFYALCYPHEIARTELKLYKFSILDGSYQVVSAPIPVASMRIESDINLFYSGKADDFICAVQEFTDRQHSSIKVYSLASPPVSTASYLAAIHPPVKSRTAFVYYLLAMIVIVIPGLGYYIYVRRKKPLPAPEKASEKPVEAIPLLAANHIEKNKNAVFLLGEFLAFDRKGQDITHLFSPKIKQLFVLILLHSGDGKGISSRKISAKLWPDKDLAKTKNIKGVTFNHLRSIIADIDGIELLFLNDSYSFKICEDLFCDFCVLSTMIRDGGRVADHLPLIARGPLLKDLPEALLDDVKSGFEDQLIGLLLPELKKRYESGDYKQALEVAKLILGMDAFNEEAIVYQLRSFRRLRGIEYSKKAYEQFTQDYQRSLGVAYHVSFDKIVH